VTVDVTDDGRGFDGAESSSGFGLVGMRERVELVGGKLAIASEPGRGTKVSVVLPAAHVAADPSPGRVGSYP
jgi:signal transduction histidine kinase